MCNQERINAICARLEEIAELKHLNEGRSQTFWDALYDEEYALENELTTLNKETN